ncbi:hypothetical protein DPMN_169466 [Dreissena polymorpha]|uniref:SWIM-type domain-containing protein n=1 Tax=Dreissena polymorpha TaxID=45954 RepID=A0A9D4DXU3_DREPO|nr:hypothetical protein DPMN_169466 [Dreissena polymorpha]
MPSITTQKENQKPNYDVWLCMSKRSGQIHSAGCNCNAGDGESCSHIARLMFGSVDLAEKKKDGLNSSTSSECWWIKPSKKSPRRSQDLAFRKHKFNDTIPQSVKKNITLKSEKTAKPFNILNFSEKLLQL